jgi:hypothetical protein
MCWAGGFASGASEKHLADREGRPANALLCAIGFLHQAEKPATYLREGWLGRDYVVFPQQNKNKTKLTTNLELQWDTL